MSERPGLGCPASEYPANGVSMRLAAHADYHAVSGGDASGGGPTTPAHLFASASVSARAVSCPIDMHARQCQPDCTSQKLCANSANTGSLECAGPAVRRRLLASTLDRRLGGHTSDWLAKWSYPRCGCVQGGPGGWSQDRHGALCGSYHAATHGAVRHHGTACSS